MMQPTTERTDNEECPETEEIFSRYYADREHACQVGRLSLRLFDELEPLHRLGGSERKILKYAALFHDLGWIGGVKAHHKHSRDIILRDPLIPLTEDERPMAAAIARYHRKSLPNERHEEYAALTPAWQLRVSALAAILRVADGLDASHDAVVTDLECLIEEERIIIRCSLTHPASYELAEAEKKSELMRIVFSRDIVIG